MAITSLEPLRKEIQDPFQRLPREILFSIVNVTPDLSTLWNFSKASDAVASLLDDCGGEIIETVMSASEPERICTIIRTVAAIRLLTIPYCVIEDFLHSSPGVRCSYGPIPSTASPTIIRSLLASAHHIHRLTHSCLQHFLNRLNTLEPSELVDPNFRYSDRSLPREPIEPWKKRPEGKKYRPGHQGPPSWIEEKRVAIAFWYLQAFFDLKLAGLRSLLAWPKIDVDTMVRVKISEVHRGQPYDHVKTALLYLKEVAGFDEDSVTSSLRKVLPRGFNLPWPARGIKVKWTTVEPVFTDGNADEWQQSAIYINAKAPGMYVTLLLARDWNSPLRYIESEPFERLGFAIWDKKRMYGMGLANPPPFPEGLRNAHQFYFKYRSLLSDEQITKANNHLEELEHTDIKQA